MTNFARIRLSAVLSAVILLACSLEQTAFAGGSTQAPLPSAIPVSPSPVPLSPTGEGRGGSEAFVVTCAIVIADTALHIRALPDPAAPVIGWLLTGQIVTITGPAKDGWLPIRFLSADSIRLSVPHSLSGWSKASYLLLMDCP